jgi:methylmalonyl-CoA mutase cobalamin-binding subunit
MLPSVGLSFEIMEPATSTVNAGDEFYLERALVQARTMLTDYVRVGEAWSRNELGIFEEHLFSQQLTKLVRTTLANLAPSGGSPRVLLTTLSGEEHTLGLLMVEALLALEDADPILLGPQTPIEEIARAARVKQADVVCLSFSSAYSPAQAAQGLVELRRLLPASRQLWAGGAGVRAIRKPIDGVSLLPEFDGLYASLGSWRDR